MTEGKHPYIRAAARELRREPTPAEDRLWLFLRRKALDGFKFYRQYPIERFITDFCCPERKLIVELDGKIHELRKEYDGIREQILVEMGYKVIRFKNEQVFIDIDAVLDELRSMLSR